VVQGKNSHPLRSLVYLSDLKLTQILDTIDEQTRRSIATELKIDLKLLSLTLSSTSVDRSLRNRSRVARLTVAERYIRQHLPVGDIASDREWIAGEMEMGWKPLQDGRTVLFCGEFRGQAGSVLVTLGGSVSNVLGYPTSEEQMGSYASTIRDAVSGNGQPERFWHDLETTARHVGAMPQLVRFLARVLARHDPEEGPSGVAMVLATPLYVEHAEHTQPQHTAQARDMVQAERPAVARHARHASAPETRRSSGTLEAAPPGDPRFIGSYEVLRRLGEGSMGIVYLVADGHGHDRALKVIRPEYAGDPEFRRRFTEEADSAHRVQDSSVARVIEAATDAWPPYLVTEFVEGPTLLEKVSRDGSLPFEQALELGIGTAAALAAIHRTGIVHRDLTPSNVILSGAGPKVVDFGVASPAAWDRDTDRLRTGTPAYSSPEQVQREKLTPASDIFSWASTMVYATTGHQPFGGKSRLGTLWEIIEDEPDLIGMPDPLRPVVLAALDKTPAARPSADKVLRDLRAIAGLGPASARQRPGLRNRLQRRRMVPLVAAALAIVGVAIAVPVLARNATGTPTSGPSHTATTNDSSTLPGPTAGSLITRTPASRPSRTATPADSPTLPAPVTVSLITRLQLPGNLLLNAVAFSPDGKYLASGGWGAGYSNGTTYLWNIATRTPSAPLTNPGGNNGGVYAVAYTPDGQTLAVGTQSGAVYLWNTSTGQATATLTKPGSSPVVAVAYSPDGRILAAGDQNGVTYLWNTTTDKPVATLPNPGGGQVNSLAWAPDGETLATADNNHGNTYLWNTTTDRLITTLKDRRGQEVDSVAYSPDGQILAVGDQIGITYLWNTSTDTVTATLPDPGKGGANSVAWAPDGNILATGDDGNGNTYLWNTTTDTRIATLPKGNGDVNSVAFAPHGNTLATDDGNYIYLWSLTEK
jgi:serine/threonine protein kinase/sugar lactone lactonase YvrE